MVWGGWQGYDKVGKNHHNNYPAAEQRLLVHPGDETERFFYVLLSNWGDFVILY